MAGLLGALHRVVNLTCRVHLLLTFLGCLALPSASCLQ